MFRFVVLAFVAGLVTGAPVSLQKDIQPQVVPLQDQAQAQAAADPTVPATSPGPLLDWATGQPLPVAPVAEAPPVPAAVPAVPAAVPAVPAAVPAEPAAVPAEAVADTSPLPQMYEGDTRITGAADSNCVSIMAGTSDWWCATTCATRQDAASCPPTMCKCDAAAKADADAKAAAAIASHKEAEDAIKAATDAMAPTISPAAVAPAAVAPAAVAPAAAQEGSDVPLMSHEEAEAQVKAAADAVKEAADEVKASMLPSPVPGAAPAKRCTAILETASDEWCMTTCATSYCPPTACKCDEPEEAVPKTKLDTAPATQDAQAVAAPVAAVDASPAPDGPGVDWATGQPLPQAPTAVPEPAYEMPVDPAVPQVAETPATPAAPAAVPAPAVPETAATPAAPVPVPVPAVPAPVAAPVDDRIANAADSNCVSIMAGTSDWWCATTCASSGASASACPETMCKCDDDAKAESDAKAAEAMEAQKAAEDAVKAAATAITGASPAPVAVAPVAVAPVAVAPVAVAPVAVSPAPMAQQQAQAVAPTDDEKAAAHKAAEDAVKEAAATAPGVTAAAVPAASPEPAGKNCKAILETASDEWCTTTCATSYCPPTACKCDE